MNAHIILYSVESVSPRLCIGRRFFAPIFQGNDGFDSESEKKMKTVKGKFAEAMIFTDNVEDYALAQVRMICDNEAADGSVIRVMPDVHPGKIGPVGLTMTVKDSVLPGLVGIDIGCGVSAMKLKTKRVEYETDEGSVGCAGSGW